MKEINNYVSNMGQYSAGDGFMVEIIKNNTEDTYESWIYHHKYGVKMLMVAVPVVQQRYREFLDIVERNLDEDKRVYSDLYIYED